MPEMPLFDGFPRFMAPETGRAVVQLTRGPSHAYPLYYFIPTFTADARYLIHHRAASGEVQLVRLDLRTGESVQLTHAQCADTEWRPWCVPSGRGVLDHRSVLNVARNEVICFDGNEARAVHVETLADRPLFTLPVDRAAASGAAPARALQSWRSTSTRASIAPCAASTAPSSTSPLTTTSTSS